MGKYLPIGTVCSLTSTNRKYVIMGYFSLEYKTSIKMYDYIGVPYPEGLLLRNKSVSFNHEDISDIEFLGFSDENFKKFNEVLLNQSREVEYTNAEKELFENFKFDANGVVVYEYDYVEDEERFKLSPSLSKEISANPFNKKYNLNNRDNDSEENEWTVFKEYKFDEDGNLISEKDIDNSVNESSFATNGNVVSDEIVGDDFQKDTNSDEKIYVDEDIVFVKNNVYSQLMFDKEGNVLIAETKEN